VWSAKTDDALGALGGALAAFFETSADVNIADAAHTLQIGRQALPFRGFAVGDTPLTVAGAIRRFSSSAPIAPADGDAPSVVFMFPGGGAQYGGMAQGLYEREAVFRAAVDECALEFSSHLGADIRQLLYPAAGLTTDIRTLESPGIALATLFTVEYALASLWMSWGVRPGAVIGHSMGEYTAACIAGVLTLADAIRLVATRGRLFETLSSGAMLSVPMAESDVAPYLGDRLSIAAVNRPNSCVLSGPEEAIDGCQRRLADQEIDSTKVHISVAAHSEMVEPILDEFAECVRSVSFHEPKIPLLSNVTGTWVTAAEVTRPEYWVRHLRDTVRFSDGLAVLFDDPGRVLLEVGPGQTLCTFARSHPSRRGQVVAASLRHPKEESPDVEFILATAGRLWASGVSLDWKAMRSGARPHRVSLPGYPFARVRHWIENSAARTSGAGPEPRDVPSAVAPFNSTEIPTTMIATTSQRPAAASRKDRVLQQLTSILYDLSGIEAESLDPFATFLELGFDSLFLTQANTAFKKRFKVKITFRQLFEEAPTLDALAAYIDARLPADALPAPEPAPTAPAAASVSASMQAPSEAAADAGFATAPANGVEGLIQQQLAIMARQLDVLRGGSVADVTPTLPSPARVSPAPAAARERAHDPSNKADGSKFGPWRALQKTGTELTQQQTTALRQLIADYNAKTKESKRLTQKFRSQLADNRTVAGFNVQWKEMVYQIVSNGSKGSRIWDVDGNEYVDVTLCFGANLLGHSPDFVMEAVREQLDTGIEIGAQSKIVGDVISLVCEMTGCERVAFTHSGSEAVLFALRVARAVTDRDKVVMFEGDIHGREDIVLGRSVEVGGTPRTFPASTGIPGHVVEDAIVLKYGTPEALETIRAHAHELAAILVEPVRTRNPDLQPLEFMREVRRIASEAGALLIFDEVVTGFRVHPGGAQAYFDVRADLTTYGKVLGGGMPIGMVAGPAKHIDHLDGGMWQFGDESFPEVGMTVSGGTFIKHPLTLAAARALLRHLKECGPALQYGIAEKTHRLANTLNERFAKQQVPIHIEHFSSYFLPRFLTTERRFEGLYYCMLRNKGVHVYLDYPCFLSAAHSDADVDFLIEAFGQAALDMQEAGFLPRETVARPDTSEPPSRKAMFRESAVTVAPDSEWQPLTDPQTEIWLATQLGRDASCAFNLSVTLDHRGPLDAGVLDAAVQGLTKRHDALRLVFEAGGRGMKTLPEVAIPIVWTDWSADKDEIRESKWQSLLRTDSATPFDLVTGPLARVQVVRLASDHVRIVLTAHHIICDGWSLGVMVSDLGRLYAKQTGQQSALPDHMPFSEYVRDWHDQQSGPDDEETETFWLRQFADVPSALDLPTDRPRPPTRSYSAGQSGMVLPPSVVQELRAVADREGATLFALLKAAYDVLLHRLTGQRDFVVGLAVAGQLYARESNLVGHCVHLLPLRSTVDPGEPMRAFLERTRRQLLDAQDNASYTFGRLLRRLNVSRDPSRVPLMSAIVTYERATEGDLLGAGMATNLMANPKLYCNFDLELYLTESSEGLRVDFHYNTDLFDADTADRWSRYYAILLDSMRANGSVSIGELQLMSKEERQRLLVEWNNNRLEVPAHVGVHDLVERQAQQTPDAVAIVDGEAEWTYADLVARANRLAHHLQALGIGAEDLVGICLPRTAELIASVLAVLKAGGAYVPLDPAYPAERIAFMLADSKSKAVITQSDLVDALPQTTATIVRIDTDWEPIANQPAIAPAPTGDPANLAYVIYTSGSTGTPKGVAIEHRSTVALLTWAQTVFEPRELAGVLASTSVCFDLSVFEMFLPLSSGGSVIIASDALALPSLPAASRVTLVNTVPSAMTELVRNGSLPASVKTINLAGEPLTVALVKEIYETTSVERVYDLYGPSEDTTYSTWTLRTADGPYTIGRPIANTQAYVLDGEMRPVPIGVVGEIYLGGFGLARGYLDRPDLTAERFVANPFSDDPKSRLYRTGDLARWRADGTLEFLGRKDNQVKLRGFRIELGEIEAALERHDGVAEAVVVVRKVAEGDQRLVAYIVLTDKGQGTPQDIKTFLRRIVPEYMVPANFVTLDAIPLTPNGKVDHRALPNDVGAFDDGSQPYSAPETELEKTIAEIWKTALNVPRVGRTDDFFELGGHSILAARVAVDLQERLGVDLSMGRLFEASTVERLAAHVDMIKRLGTAGTASGEEQKKIQEIAF
jgi:amino acid adenylation domain-containing protein